MPNVIHQEASGYEKTEALANADAAVFPNSKCNHSFDGSRLTSASQQSSKNEVVGTGNALPVGLGSDAVESEKTCVLGIFRAAYCIACSKRQGIETDLTLLVGIARALKADIYSPAFALERALELGLVGLADAEVAS